MNITIGAIVVFTFLVPGYLYFLGYYHYPFNENKFAKSTLEEITKLLVASVVLHLFFYLALDKSENLLKLKDFVIYYYDEFFKITSNQLVGKDTHGTDIVVVKVSKVIGWFFIFWIVSYGLGIGINILIRKCRIDSKIRFFRYNNPWYYHLNANSVGSPKNTIVILDILSRINNDVVVLYRGIKEEYYLNKEGNLRSIVIKGVSRQPFDPDAEKQGDRFQISSEKKKEPFIIPGEHIFNIYARFFQLSIRKKDKDNTGKK